MTRSSQWIIWGASGAYFLGLSVFMTARGVALAPGQLLIAAALIALFLLRNRPRVAAWSPIFLFVFGYQFFRGMAPALAGTPLHVADLVAAERRLFAAIPTIALQRALLRDWIMWYDVVLSVIYVSFYFAVAGFSIYLWQRHRSLFSRFSVTLLVLAYLGYSTYIAFPAAPPWMAGAQGVLPPVTRVVQSVVSRFLGSSSFPVLLRVFSSNDIAAMPSMHAAITTLIFLYALATRRRKPAVTSGVYAASMYVALVYLGEHYVIDALVGTIYALAAFTVMFLKDYASSRTS